MRRSIRVTVLLTAGAFGFLLAFAVGASAEITNPTSPFTPYQPKTYTPSKASAKPANPDPTSAPATVATGQTPGEAGAATPAAAPAPEHIVTRASSPIRKITAPPQGQAQPVQQVVSAVSNGFHDVGVFLAEVASACQVHGASSSGGPVLVVAVLGLAAALERRRISQVRWATDEKTPEFLYAGDVIAPG